MKLTFHDSIVNITHMNRFDLEEAMSQLHNVGDDIDIVLHSYLDSKIRPTEDQLANMLIGLKELHNARYQKMWQIFEHLISNKTITNKGCEQTTPC